jgi:hypothetical protein
MRTFRNLLSDRRGAMVINVAIGIVLIFGFAVVAIDMSMLQLAKTQLQNAADAAALAAATVLFYSDGDQAVATAEAIRIAGLNEAVQDIQRPVMIGESDVTFPGGDSVTVVTHRTTATGDPVTHYFLRVLGDTLVNKGDVRATATAAVQLICGTDCLKPFCVPDRWADADSDGYWDPADEYEDANGNGVWDAGEPLTEDWNGNGVWDAAEEYDPEQTGYRVPDDLGVQVILRPSRPNQEGHMEWYFTVNYPPKNTGDPIPGADITNEWILGCEPYVVNIGDELQKEPGGMYGPTIGAGMEELVALDPNAFWNSATGEVDGSENPENPRVIKIPAFDPTLGLHNCGPGRECVIVSKIMVIFVEEVTDDADVIGRFVKTVTEGVPDPNCPGAFMSRVALVR